MEAQSSEVSASSSLRLWKTLATDVSRCFSPGLRGVVCRPFLTTGVESKAESLLRGRG